MFGLVFCDATGLFNHRFERISGNKLLDIRMFSLLMTK